MLSLLPASLFPISVEVRRKVNSKNIVFVVFIWPADRAVKTTTLTGVTVKSALLLIANKENRNPQQSFDLF